MERLDKFLCDSGAGTRSQVKLLLKAGRVTVDGKVEKDNGKNLHLIRLGNTRGGDFAVSYEENLLGGVNVLASPALREAEGWTADGLYAEEEPSAQSITLRWIPYYAWANRGVGEMRVWVRQ